MNKKIVALAEESIKCELAISEIYFLFGGLFPRDSDFWFDLVLEEENHAALIKNGMELFEPIGAFPHKMLSDKLQKLEDSNKRLNSLLEQFKNTHPSREEAFNTALGIETSIGELHFQNFQNKKNFSSFEEIFHQLNENDKDHAKRIRSYMRDNNILLQSEQNRIKTD